MNILMTVILSFIGSIPSATDYLKFLVEKQAVVDTRVYYGEHERQFVQVYSPSNDGPAWDKTLVWVHGGGWEGGEPMLTENGWGSDYHHTAQRYRAQGWTVVSVGHRVSYDAPWPAQIDDVQSALEWAHQFTGDRPLYIGGYSSGGHLAAMAGAAWNADTNKSAAVRPDMVINMAGPLDPHAWTHTEPRAVESVARLMGDAAPEEISVLSYIDEMDPPSFMSYSNGDDIVPLNDEMETIDIYSSVIDTHLVQSYGDHRLLDIKTVLDPINKEEVK